MIGVDTNVLLRLFLRDDEEQRALAERCIERATREAAIMINPIVLAEFAWTLARVRRLQRDDVATTSNACFRPTILASFSLPRLRLRSRLAGTGRPTLATTSLHRSTLRSAAAPQSRSMRAHSISMRFRRSRERPTCLQRFSAPPMPTCSGPPLATGCTLPTRQRHG
jgi:predicted nucleic acid-binding protein